MSIFATERPVMALHQILIEKIGVALEEIEAEFNDGLSLGRPDSSFTRDRSTGVADAFQLEIYEVGATSFPRADHEAQTGTESLYSETPLVVQITIADLDGVSSEKMATRTRRIAAAVLRVLVKFCNAPTLNGAHGMLCFVPNSIEFDFDDDDVTEALIGVTAKMLETLDADTEDRSGWRAGYDWISNEQF